MKKLFFAAALTLSACAFAKEATMTQERVSPGENCMRSWTPFALTLSGTVGLPWGEWDVYGMQLGVFNYVYQFSGLQLGVVNVATRAYGVQIGVINVITSDDIPFLPVVNWSF